MRAVVVHESLFGNTRRVAEAVATALQAAYEVTLLRTVDVRPEHLAGTDLLVLGAPTHGHGLPKRGTREQTRRQGVAAELIEGRGMRDILEMLPAGSGALAAAFDTRLRWPVWLSGQASRTIARALVARGYRLVAERQSFVVAGTEGPLRVGELRRAGAWGAELVRRAAAMGSPAAPLATHAAR